MSLTKRFNSLKDGRVPFVLGICGHRILPNKNISDDLFLSVKEAIRYWYETLNEITPICVLTGMAEGSDTISIEAALALQQELGQENIQIVGTLPMEKAEYVHDFEPGSDQLKKFKDLCHRLTQNDNQIVVLKHALTETQYQRAVSSSPDQGLRNSLYLNQSLFIAKYSNALMAMWDGHESRGAGGTGDAVFYKLGKKIHWPPNTFNHALESMSDFDGQVGGVVHHIRMKNGKSEQEAISPNNLSVFKMEESMLTLPKEGTLYTKIESKSAKLEVLADIVAEEFNELLSQLGLYNDSVIKVKALYSSTHETNAGLYQTAEKVAAYFQTRYRRVMVLFFIMVLPGFIGYELAGSFNNSMQGALILSTILVVLVICWLMIKQSKRLNYKWRYQLARDVAEGIRIRRAMNAADIAPQATPLISRKFRARLPLISQVIALCEMDWWDEKKKADRGLIEKNWLTPQIEFLKSRLDPNWRSISQLLFKRPLRAAQISKSLSVNFFYLAITIGIFLLLAIIINQFIGNQLVNDFNEVLMYSIQYCLVSAGLISLWSELAGYHSTAMGYKSLLQLYLKARVLLYEEDQQMDDIMLTELAKEAMSQHLSWNFAEIDNDLKQK